MNKCVISQIEWNHFSHHRIIADQASNGRQTKIDRKFTLDFHAKIKDMRNKPLFPFFYLLPAHVAAICCYTRSTQYLREKESEVNMSVIKLHSGFVRCANDQLIVQLYNQDHLGLGFFFHSKKIEGFSFIFND